MNSLLRYALVCVLVLLATTGMAQQKAGDVELQFQAMYYTTVGMDMTMGQGSISAKIGPYVTDNLQIGVGPMLTVTTMTTPTFNPSTYTMDYDTETETTFGSTAFIVYSFLMRGAKAVPYIGAQYFKSDFSNGDDNGSMGVNVGLKYFFTKKVALDAGGNYLFSLNTDAEGGILLFAVGLSFLL